MKLSIIVPAYNEEENIGEVVSRIEQVVTIPHELLAVNDHSNDRTGEILTSLVVRYKNLKVVDNRLDNGFANAVKFGFQNASGDVLIPVMADLCDDLFTIEKMYVLVNQGYDVVCGSRYSKGGARLGGSRFKGFLSSFGGVSLSYLLGVPTRDIANAFKMYRRQVIERIDIQSSGFEISMEIPLKAYYSGFKITEVPTVWKERTKGKSSFKIFKLIPSYLRLYFWALCRKAGKRCA